MAFQKSIINGVADARLIWAFGKPYQFHWVSLRDPTTGGRVPMHTARYKPGSFEKTMIVLHAVGSNNPGALTAETWTKPLRPAKPAQAAIAATATTPAVPAKPAEKAEKPAAAHIVVDRSDAHTYTSSGNPPARASRAGIAKLHPEAVMDDSIDFVDAIRAIDLDANVFHGSYMNTHTIGIEHINLEYEWTFPIKDESLDPKTAATLVKQHRICHLPDKNKCVTVGKSFLGDWASVATDFQTYDEAQYNTMILLLRAITIEKRIPRQFLGNSWLEHMKRYVEWNKNTKLVVNNPPKPDARESLVSLRNFRGIVRHSNQHIDKSCPGVMFANRLFRAIIDEWWMPIELSGKPRPYYSGPFWLPAFVLPDNNGLGTTPMYFKWGQGDPPTVTSTTASDVDLNTFVNFSSFYDLNKVAQYYSMVENNHGGLFPVGENNLWHGGVHLEVNPNNPVVYAAASGTIVAARLSGDALADDQAGYGSQRFVLIRHAVYWHTENDPSLPPRSPPHPRLDYTREPTYVFSLYMHLREIKDLYSQHVENPRWYNKWLRNQAAAKGGSAEQTPQQSVLDPIVGLNGLLGRVFNPDVEVSVGDVLGLAGTFARLDSPDAKRSMIHFEIFSHKDHEITAVGKSSFEDSQDPGCNIEMINNLIAAEAPEGGLLLDAIPRMRDYRVCFRSEWSLDDSSLLLPLMPASSVESEWRNIQPMMWVKDAIAANPKLSEQLGESGFFWHYHPITFMQAINTLVMQESHALGSDQLLPSAKINVLLDEKDYLTEFVNGRSGAFYNVAASATLQVIPHEDAEFDVTQADLACRPPRPASRVPFSLSSTGKPVGSFANAQDQAKLFDPTALIPHDTGAGVPKCTHFSLALLNIFQQVRARYNKHLLIASAYVCPNHEADSWRCCVVDDSSCLDSHSTGTAIDFKPTGNVPTAADVASLWIELKAVITTVNADYREHGGSPCRSDIPAGYSGISCSAQNADVTAKLNATPQLPLTQAELAAFCVHLALVPIMAPLQPSSSSPTSPPSAPLPSPSPTSDYVILTPPDAGTSLPVGLTPPDDSD